MDADNDGVPDCLQAINGSGGEMVQGILSKVKGTGVDYFLTGDNRIGARFTLPVPDSLEKKRPQRK